VQNQGKRAKAKVHFISDVLICSLCLEAPAKRSSNKNKKNAKEAKVELRKRALAFAWLQQQRKRAKPGQKGKSSFHFRCSYL
jgi:hypothetical protein